MNEQTVVGNSHFEEGRERMSMEEKETFLEKAVRYVKTVGNFARLLAGLMLDERVDKKVKIFAGAVLAYIIAPADFIPEIFSGLFGMLDDFVLSAFAINVILNWVDPVIVRSHWRGDKDLLGTIQRGIKNAEVLIPDAIVRKIQQWIGTHTEKALAAVQPAPVLPKEETKTSRRRKSGRSKKPSL